MTKIVAGGTVIIGKLKHYEFSEEGAVFRLFINERDPTHHVEVSLPKPNSAMISAIQEATVQGLSDAEINFNRNTIKMKLGDKAIKRSNAGIDKTTIGGKFFS